VCAISNAPTLSKKRPLPPACSVSDCFAANFSYVNDTNHFLAYVSCVSPGMKTRNLFVCLCTWIAGTRRFWRSRHHRDTCLHRTYETHFNFSPPPCLRFSIAHSSMFAFALPITHISATRGFNDCVFPCASWRASRHLHEQTVCTNEVCYVE